MSTDLNLQRMYVEKFASEEYIFGHIRRGGRIFIGTGCAEPQYLVKALIRYVENNPKAFFDTEVLHVWTLGVAAYTQEKFKHTFRHNSFFVGHDTRTAVNTGLADYTPVFLSHVPRLFYQRLVPIDIALVQTSPPDRHGYMSLGIGVDIVKAAVETARIVIAQVNTNMPRVHGDGFIHLKDVNFIISNDEPLLEYTFETDMEAAQKIGQYVSRLIEDGDTLQVGYGNIPNSVAANLKEKRHLGIHSELLSDGLVELMRCGAVDNSRKTRNHGKTVASFCMGNKDTYAFMHDNPSIEFRTIDYTDNPMVIASHENMAAINTALEIDLTGQSSAESLGKTFFSGIGGQVDFMRGAVMAKGGKAILAIESTADAISPDGGKTAVSRIVPFLREGAGVTLNRGDVHYVVTEYGIASLHGKNIRERAMELISIAHPSFRGQLIEEAIKANLIYKDQTFIHGSSVRYPEELEIYQTLKNNIEILLRPVKITDEPMLKDFFYSLSDDTLYKRFISVRKDMPHERLQEFISIDYVNKLVMVAVVKEGAREFVAGIGQYTILTDMHAADAALVVRDSHHGTGIGRELLNYLTLIARKRGLLGFTAEVISSNRAMVALFDSLDADISKTYEDGLTTLKIMFRR
ncbi:GNAT family N-acetyltransferase [Candidatus Magnetominusculus dajiuhuensis]|uniref:GNAT family N-acetyltransferase n=1 Tax=Candidatus Magnetominusculus dajiuhuensis TaxID=3137712 RepID=UPI003B433B8A